MTGANDMGVLTKPSMLPYLGNSIKTWLPLTRSILGQKNKGKTGIREAQIEPCLHSTSSSDVAVTFLPKDFTAIRENKEKYLPGKTREDHEYKRNYNDL